MSKFVLLNARIFAGGADLTGVSNKVELACEAEEKDATSFASEGWKENLGGLFATTISAGGQWEAGDAAKVDDETWAKLNGRTVHPWTLAPDGADAGDLAWLTQVLRTSYKLGDAVGEVAPWEASASGSAALLRGAILHPPGTARTSTGDGTAVQAGAVQAGQKVFGALHVLSVSGTSTPTLTVKVQSASDDEFTSANDRLTFSAATGVTSEWKSASGAITDEYWRVSWTISGSSPSFLFVASLGIG